MKSVLRLTPLLTLSLQYNFLSRSGKSSNQNNEVTFIGELLNRVPITNNPGGKIPDQNNEFTFIGESLSRMPITEKPVKYCLNQNMEFTFDDIALMSELLSRMTMTDNPEGNVLAKAMKLFSLVNCLAECQYELILKEKCVTKTMKLPSLVNCFTKCQLQIILGENPWPKQ